MDQNDGSKTRTPGGGTRYTGRTLVLLADDDTGGALKELENRAGIAAVRSRDVEGDESFDAASGSIVFEELGVAVIEGDPEQTKRMVGAAVAGTGGRFVVSEPERVVYALTIQQPETTRTNGRERTSTFHAAPSSLLQPQDEPPKLARDDLREFLRGYREAASHLEALLAQGAQAEAQLALDVLDVGATAEATWGLNITKAGASRFSGRGIRVAVLDTGMDLLHPDFAGRTVVSASFIAGETVQDGHGHGTHCIGTSCGPCAPLGGVPRYGVAYEADIYPGKVLSNAGSGADGGILAGIDWAVRNKCAVISMSLGADVEPGAPFSTIFETAARRAASKGSIIIAAAGNASSRPGYVAPVGHPANCPSIAAVAAVDERLGVASFSSGGLTAGGGEVNVAGPGVNVFSSWPLPLRYRSISGTSMATPHVAGITALYAQATGLRGFPLLNELLRRSRRLSPVRDFGWGLVQSV